MTSGSVLAFARARLVFALHPNVDALASRANPASQAILVRGGRPSARMLKTPQVIISA